MEENVKCEENMYVYVQKMLALPHEDWQFLLCSKSNLKMTEFAGFD